MNFEKRNNLLKALATRPPSHDERLQKTKIKGQSISEKSDWLWHQLLSAMSTMGNSRGYEGLIENEIVYKNVCYNHLMQINKIENIESNLFTALSIAKVRRPNIKVRWLIHNWEIILDCGGLETIQQFILNSKGREIKIRLLKIFEGIGEKYSRNIFMEMCHPDFINSIAIDERILEISTTLEINRSKLKYTEHEDLFIAIANDSQLTPWELDRLLYFFKPHYLALIKMDGKA